MKWTDTLAGVMSSGQSVTKGGSSPDPDVVEISHRGWMTLWCVYGVMTISAFAFILMALKRPTALSARRHHFCCAAICCLASVAYYAMATDGGNTRVLVYFEGDVIREVFYARYIDWFFTTPLLLIDLLMLAGVPWSDILWIVFFDVLMILTGLFGALTPSVFRWGWFGIGCACMLAVFIGLGMGSIQVTKRAQNANTPGLAKLYHTMMALLLCTWLVYPIVWGLCEGANMISVDAEVAAYGGLDLTAKALFSWILVLSFGVVDKVDHFEQEQPANKQSLLAHQAQWANDDDAVLTIEDNLPSASR